MIEPRRSLTQLLQKRDSNEFHSFYAGMEDDSMGDDETSQYHDAHQHQQQQCVVHNEPDIPIHPALEYEVCVEAEVDVLETLFSSCRRSANHNSNNNNRRRRKRRVILCDWKLMVSFVGLVVFGAGNSISLKLQAMPMYNYPNFLNLFCNMIYIPICFAYIIPSAIRRRLCQRRAENSNGNNQRASGDNDDEDDYDDEERREQSTVSNEEVPLSARPENPLECNNNTDAPTSFNSNNNNDDDDDDSLRTPLLSAEHGSSPPLQSASANSPLHSDDGNLSRSQQQQQQQSDISSTTTSNNGNNSRSSSPSFRDFAIMGLLDSLATTMQVFSAIYLPGPLLILLPQAAIPLSFFVLVSPWYNNNNNNNHDPTGGGYRWTQYIGAAAVVFGILVLMEPLLTNRLSPEFYCEAIDFDSDCTVCKTENTRESCLSHLLLDDDDEVDNHGGDEGGAFALWRHLHEQEQSSINDHSTPKESLCQWIPFDEATREDEILTFIWSVVLIASCIPMTLSTFYKEWALGDGNNSELASEPNNRDQGNVVAEHREREQEQPQRDLPPTEQDQHDPIYLNGWISVFQLFFAIPLCVLGGMVSSPMVPPEEILENLWHGFQCYFQGIGSITTTCHPDVLCGEYSFWLVNLHLFTTLGYSFFMLYCLKYGTTTIFFLALTVMVPLGATAFVLPFMPEAVTPCLSEWLGSICVVVGLILYRFFDATTTDSRPNDDEDEQMPEEPISRAFFALQRDLSACLLSEPATRSGDV